MRRADSGSSSAKTISTLAILAALAFVAVKTLPVYVHAYELQDHLRELVIQAMAGNRPSVESIRNNVAAKAADLDLPVRPDDVEVALTPSKITISVKYTVPIDLVLYTWKLTFTPSADNRSLT